MATVQYTALDDAGHWLRNHSWYGIHSGIGRNVPQAVRDTLARRLRFERRFYGLDPDDTHAIYEAITWLGEHRSLLELPGEYQCGG